MRTFTEEEVEEMMGKSIEHDGCKGCAYESERKHGEHCSVCEGTKQGDMYKRATNADRIRSMSDEELAQLIEQISVDSMDTISFGTKDYEEILEHKETALKWLQSEVQEQH